MKLKIRPYSPDDRQAVRDICCATGFMGDPIDPVFVDREAFADFFTRYYTDLEPENALVAVEEDGRVVGYLLGCLNFRSVNRRQLWLILTRTVPQILWRVVTFRYNKASFKFISWFLFKAAGETPKSVPDAAHFHVNMFGEYRNGWQAAHFSFHKSSGRAGYQRSLRSNASLRGSPLGEDFRTLRIQIHRPERDYQIPGLP
jgi:hypothetical protein